MEYLEQLDNDSLLEEYLYYQTLVDNLDVTANSEYYIKYVLDKLDVTKKEVLNRMGGIQND